jgi:hypothetical protein
MKIANNANIIFCDDIREEVGNKMSLMGIYSDKILVPSLPISFKSFNIIAFFDILKKPIKKFRFVITLPDAKPVDLSGEPPPSAKEQKHAHIVLCLAPMRIENEGKATVEVYINDAKTPEVKKDIEIVMQPKAITK